MTAGGVRGLGQTAAYAVRYRALAALDPVADVRDRRRGEAHLRRDLPQGEVGVLPDQLTGPFTSVRGVGGPDPAVPPDPAAGLRQRHLLAEPCDLLRGETGDGGDGTVGPPGVRGEDPHRGGRAVGRGQGASMGDVGRHREEPGVLLVAVEEPRRDAVLPEELDHPQPVGAVDDGHGRPVHEDRRELVGGLREDPDVVGVLTLYPWGEAGPEKSHRYPLDGQVSQDGLLKLEHVL